MRKQSGVFRAMGIASAILLGAAALFALLWRMGGGAVWFALLLTALTFSYHLLMRLLVGGLVNRTKHSFDPNNAWFRPKRWERRFYAFLRIKRWKRFLPTALPEQFSLQTNTLDEVVQAMCRAELVHEISAALSYLSVLFVLWSGDASDLAIFLSTATAASLFDLVFVAMQRFNRPRLLAVQNRKITLDCGHSQR